MARIAQGKSGRATPILTRGLTNMLWVQNGEARQVDGVYFSITGGAEKAGGLRALIDWRGNPGPHPFQGTRINALGAFRIPHGPVELLVSFGGKVVCVRGHESPGEDEDFVLLSERHDPSTPYEGEYFAARNDWIYITNGKDQNMKWNGRYVAPVGVSVAPSRPEVARVVAEAYSGGVLGLFSEFSPKYSFDHDIADKTYFQYRATWVNSSGHEGPPSAPSERVAVGGVKRPDADSATLSSKAGDRALIKIYSLEQPPAEDLLWRNIYKKGKDGVYYFWRQIAANEEVAYDHEKPLPAGASVTKLNEDTMAPPTSKFVAFFRGRGYYVPTANPSFLFYSRASLPEEVASLNFMDVSSSDGEPITGLATFSDSLLVFKPSSVWMITALADGSPVMTPIVNGVGSVAPRAIAIAYNRVVFVGEKGVYQFDGGTVKPLSNELNRWWRTVNKGNLKNATTWTDESKRRLYIAVPREGKDYLDTIVVYHYELEAFSIIGGHRIYAATHYKGANILGVQLEVSDSAGVPGSVLYEANNTSELAVFGLDVHGCDVPDVHVGMKVVAKKKYENFSDERPQEYVTELTNVPVTACEPRGRIRFGPYSANETGWDSNELMEVAGVDVFFRFTGKHSIGLRWYKDRNPIPAGSLEFQANAAGVLSVKEENQDLTTHNGWHEASTSGVGTGKTFGKPETWTGDKQLYQRVKFPQSVLCREIEIEFFNEEEEQPFTIDAFVLWRVSKGAEKQR